MSLEVGLFFLSIFLGIFTVLLGKYINHMRTTRLHVNMKKDFRPFVSVVIPTWNEADVIENTIRNIEKSFYDKFEVIVVDDRSTDGTYEILKSLEKEYDNLKVLRKKGRKGKPQSINEAMEVAKGDIILLLDADSRISPEYISTHVACFSHPDINMIFTDFEPYNYKPGNIAHKVQEMFFSFVKDVIYSNIFIRMIFMGNGVFFRRKVFDKLLPIDPTTLVDDFTMASKLAKMKVVEYFSIYPWVSIQYVNSLKELWKQHMRWYYGGFREIVKFMKKGDPKYIFLYMFSITFFTSPIWFSILWAIYGGFWLLLGLYLITYAYSIFTFSQLLNVDRKLSVSCSILLPAFVMVFELSVLIFAMIKALFVERYFDVMEKIGKKKREDEWYKVKRDKA